jgi:acyl-CoA synthetase (AMP-forming)/AMP-acid ligase II
MARRVTNAWVKLGAPLILTNEITAARLRRLSEPRDLSRLRLGLVEKLRAAAPVPTARYQPDPDAAAVLLLTSGSSGAPKFVVQTHRAVVMRSLATAQLNGFDQGDVSLNWLPLDHVGGLLMSHVRDVVLRCRQVIAPIALVLEDPLRWLDWIDRYQATFTWAPNFAFALVNDRADEIGARKWNLSSMRFILNGGEPIVANQARRFLGLLARHQLPPTSMHPAWGMSETCSATTYSDVLSEDGAELDQSVVCVVAPACETLEHYRAQFRTYLNMTQAERGLIVLATSGVVVPETRTNLAAPAS